MKQRRRIKIKNKKRRGKKERKTEENARERVGGMTVASHARDVPAVHRHRYCTTSTYK